MAIVVAVLALPASSLAAAPGTISTVAGNGNAAPSADGGLATSAALNGPGGVVAAPTGGFYIADTVNFKVRRVDASGTITRIAGTGIAGFSGDGGPATSAQLYQPRGLAVAPDGDLLIADSGNDRIRRVDSATGDITTVAGGGAGGDGGPATSAQLCTPGDVAVEPGGDVLIADTCDNRIRRVDASTGLITTVAGTGTAGFSGDGGAATSADLNVVQGVALTGDGGYVIADMGNDRIRKVSSTGTITTVAGNGTLGSGGDGSPATAAELGRPNGIEVALDGTLLIPDTLNHRVRQVDSAGVIDTVAGTGTQGFSGDGGPATAAELTFPAAVTDLLGGQLLIADTGNNRIRRVEAVPAQTFVVNSTADTNDGTCDATNCTLFEAIVAANFTSAQDRITFAIGVGGPQSIVIGAPLPSITAPLEIDGTTQPGYVDTPLIELTRPSRASNGLTARAPVTIRGLAVTGFSTAIDLSSSSAASTIEGCYIGTADGLVAKANTLGIADRSPGSTIGGDTAAERNVVSANVTGIAIIDDTSGPPADGNAVMGNYIGTDATGTVDLGNDFGVTVTTEDNTIGGPTIPRGNIISGNSTQGLGIINQSATNPADGNRVESNRIGINSNASPTATDAVPNVGTAVSVDSAHNTIGPGNVVSGNNGNAVVLHDPTADDNRVIGNMIGTNPLGTVAVSNTGVGVLIDNGGSDNTIGSSASGADRNVISASTGGQGVRIEGGPTGSGTGNEVAGNFVGLAANGNTDLGNKFDGIFVRGPGNTVLANIVSGNGEDGIQIAGPNADGNTIAANRVGTDVIGTSDRGNAGAGIAVLGSSDNVIGGATLSGRNLVAGNGSDGVFIDDLTSPATPSTNNVVRGNYIGVKANGDAPLENAGNGVRVKDGGNIIGGSASGEGNLISGNGGSGVRLEADDNTVYGNLIGTDRFGERAAPNESAGVTVTGANNAIGDDVTGAGNVISGNRNEGVSITGASNVLQGNKIGIDDDGTDGIPNTRGVFLNGPDATVGGSTTAARNVISANDDEGIFIETGAPRAVIQGNYIGASATGGALGNENIDIWLSGADDVKIGGSASGEGNLIADSVTGIRWEDNATERGTVAGNFIGVTPAGADVGNRGNGVEYSVQSTPPSASDANTLGGTSPGASNAIAFNGANGVQATGSPGTLTIRDNSIHSNGLLGIDLNGIAPNDPLDADTGPNGGQNFPTLDVATANGGALTLKGKLASKASSTYTIDVFSSATCDPSGAGEGQHPVGSFTVTTDGAGDGPFNEELPPVAVGDVVTATATDSNGNTSEFSPCRTATGAPGISVGDASASESAGTASFPLTLSRPSAQTVTVDVKTADGSAGAPDDYTAKNETVTFAPGETTKSLDVLVATDALDEPDEAFDLVATGAQHATIADDRGTATIVDDDAPPALSVADTAVTEGTGGSTTATFTVTLDAPSGKTVTVDASSADGTAVEPGDYTSSAATLTFAPGDTSKTFQVPVQPDDIDENDESFTATLANPVNASLADDTATGTIDDDDAAPALSVADVRVGEDTGTDVDAVFAVSLSHPSGKTITVDADTSDGSAVAVDDYTTTHAALTFAPGETSKDFAVPVKGDAIDEPDETFHADLSSPVDATIADAQGTARIVDDDPVLPAVSAGDVTVAENGGSASLAVTLNRASTDTVKVDFATAPGSAGTSDFTATTGTVTFAPGDKSETISVPITDDTLDEDDEALHVDLTNPVNTTIADGRGDITITDNDAPPPLAIADVAVTEGTGGTKIATFTVSLAVPSAKSVTVDAAAADGTATAPADYTQKHAAFTFAPGETTKTLDVPVATDALDEPNEAFLVNLSGAVNASVADGQATGSIADDDDPPALAVGDVVVAESVGNASVPVTLSAPSGRSVTVDYATAGGSAASGSDFTPTTGTLTFAPGETVKNVAVPIADDAVDEPNEGFTLGLSSPQNASLGDGSGGVTIADDDATPLPPQQQPEQRDTDAPGFTLGGLPHRIGRAALLGDGLHLTLMPDEAVSFDIQLVARPRMLTSARSGDVVIAHEKLKLAAGRRTMTLKVLRRLRHRFTHRPAELRLTVVATDAARNSTRLVKPLAVR